MVKLLHAIILTSTDAKIIACNYCTWNHCFIVVLVTTLVLLLLINLEFWFFLD